MTSTGLSSGGHTSGGLFDIQVNGFAGIDFNSARITPGDMDQALEAMLATGVTSCLPTIITATPDQLAERFAALDQAVSQSRLGASLCPGYHLEGPFLNPGNGYAGCHPPAAMGAADYGLVEALEQRLGRPILLITLAAEVEGAIPFIAAARAAGKVVALGHTAASFEQAAAAAAAGATLSTHLGNGVPQTVHKLVNPIFAQLAEDRLWASFIADGIHLRPEALKSLLRAKGLERSILVTDATAAAAAPAGLYPFADMMVERSADGTVREPGNSYLAGSSLCLDAAVRNLVGWGLASPEAAIRMASANPVALLAPAFAAHRLPPPAGEVEWDEGMTVRAVRVGSLGRRFAA